MMTGTSTIGEDLQRLAELEAEAAAVGRLEVVDRQVGDHRQRHHRDQRVHRGERDVQRHVAAVEVAEQVGRGAARRRSQQQQPDGEQRRQVEQQHQPEADGREDEQLQDERDDHGLRLPADSGEVAHGQREAQAEHHQGQRQREQDGGQRGIHAVHGGTWGPSRAPAPLRRHPSVGPSAVGGAGLAQDPRRGAGPAGGARGGEPRPLVGAVAERLDARLPAPAQRDRPSSRVDLGAVLVDQPEVPPDDQRAVAVGRDAGTRARQRRQVGVLRQVRLGGQ